MSANGYAHICAGVLIEDHLVVTERTELRKRYDTNTGKVQGQFQTCQYTYTICGRTMPIMEEVYPKPLGTSGANRAQGYDMQVNFHCWLVKHGFATEEETCPVQCGHSPYPAWPLRHPTGVLGAVMKTYAASGRDCFQQLALPEFDKLLMVAKRRLTKIGCSAEPTLYMYAKCG